MLGQAFGCHFRAGWKRIDLSKIHHRHFNAERIVKAALRQAALQRHLTALKSWLHIAARARPLTLVATTRRFTMTGAVAAPHAFALFARTPSRFQFIEFHRQRISASALPRRSAISSGARRSPRAAMVALTILCGLLEPMHLVKTF